MELRSFNVERVWRSVVKCVIGDEKGNNRSVYKGSKRILYKGIQQDDLLENREKQVVDSCRAAVHYL